MEKSLIDKWRDISSQKFIPLQASLELTYRCNERCTHCYIDRFWDDPTRILRLEDWDYILAQLKGAGTLYLVLMGGEAMLHKNFWSIAKIASTKGFHISLITNGLKIATKDIASRLKKNPFHHINFSLYSLDAKIHDKMTTVPGSHKRTMNAIKLCLAEKIEVGVNCLLTQDNIESYFDLAHWCVDSNIQIKEDPTVTGKFNGDLAPLKLRATDEQLKTFYLTRMKYWPKSLPNAEKISSDDYVCNIAKGKCVVNPYGDLLGCTEVRRPLGNLLKNDFQTIWSGVEANKWRNIKVKDIENFADEGAIKKTQCGFSSHCEHCPGMAINEEGDAFRLTKDSIRLAKIKNEVSCEYRK